MELGPNDERFAVKPRAPRGGEPRLPLENVLALPGHKAFFRGSRGSARGGEPPRLRPEEPPAPPVEPPAPPEEPGSALGSSRELGPLPRGRTGCAGFVHPSHPTYLPTRTMIDAPTATRATTEKLKSTLLTPLWHGR